MDMLPDADLQRARSLMRRRGLTDAALAAEVGTSRSYVCRIVNGGPRNGRRWEQIRDVLSAQDQEDVIILLERVPRK